MSRGAWHKQVAFAEPDGIDCNAMIGEIERNFHLGVKIECKYGFDFKTVVVKAGVWRGLEDFEVHYQALVKFPQKSTKPIEAMTYTALWDVYQQADNSIPGMTPRPQYDWKTMRSRRRK